MISQSARKRQGGVPASIWKAHSEPTITVNGQTLQVVDNFAYLASILSRAEHIDDGVTARIAKASVAFSRLRVNVWDRNGIRLDKKFKAYKGVEPPTFLLACETWAIYQCHAKRFNHVHLCCLRMLVKIRWQGTILDTENLQGVHILLKLEQLRWTFQVTGIPDLRLPKKVFYGELQLGMALPRWPEETLQRQLKSLSKGFQPTTRVLGTDCI